MRPIVIKQMRGLNTSRARLQLQPGEVGCLQNLRPRPFDNWAKRRGVETAIVQSDPVNGIFEWDFDEGVMPCFEAGGTFTFYPPNMTFTVTQGGTPITITPDPSPVSDPLDPTGTGTAGGISFGLEQAMRALQERVCRRGGSPLDWPNASYDATGAASTVVCATVPLSTFYGSASTAVDLPQPGLYRYDCYYSASTRTTLIQSVVDALDAEATVWLQVYPEGQSSLTMFTSATLWGGAKPTVTATNYLTVMAQIKEAMKGLMYYAAGASWTNLFSKNSTPQTGTDCDDSKSKAQAAFSSSPWLSTGATPRCQELTEQLGASFISTALRARGNPTLDLTNHKSCRAALFLRAAPLSGGLSNGSTFPVTGDGSYHISEYATVGTNWTGSSVGDTDIVPSFTSSCPSGGIAKGWIAAESVILFFNFTYAA